MSSAPKHATTSQAAAHAARATTANQANLLPHHAHAATMLDALSDALLLLDENGIILSANSAAEPLLMQGRNKLIGQSITDYAPQQTALMRAIKQCWLYERPQESFETHLTPRHQPPLPVRVSLRPALDPTGATTEGVLAIFSTQAAAVHAHETSTDSAAYMAAVLAHEIKNPLAGIRGAAQLVAAYIPDTMQKMTQLIIGEVDRIRALVEQMEVFNQPTKPALDAINIHEVLHHALLLAQPYAPAACTVREQFDPSLPPVQALQHTLVQVLLNLIKNAYEAMAETPDATLVLCTDYWRESPLGMPCVRLRMIDNGPGIPEALQPSIFEPFISTKEGGKGLGLAVVAKLMHDAAGRLQLAESYAGCTCFELLFPIAK